MLTGDSANSRFAALTTDPQATHLAADALGRDNQQEREATMNSSCFSQRIQRPGIPTRGIRNLALLAAAGVVVGAGAPVLGSSLYSIGVLNPTNGFSYSEVRAISGDGTYAAGASTSAGHYSGGSPQAGSLANTNAPVVWSVAGGLVELPNPNGTHCIAIGVANGVGANAGEIMLSGLHEKATVLRLYTNTIGSGIASGRWTDAGTLSQGTFGAASLRGGFANNTRNNTPNPDTGFPPLGAWWNGATRDSGRAAALRMDPMVGWDGLTFNVQSISGYARVVGRYTGVSPSVAQWDSNSDSGSVPNSSGARADGYGISTAFGTNLSDLAEQWICGQVQSYNGSQMQAFRWNRADSDMTYLGSLAPAGGGDTGNNSSVAYTIANNGVTGGRSYFGATGASPAYEVATVWDTSGTWDTTGGPKSLEALLVVDGVDTGAWTHLTRVYATSDDGKVLGGYGIWAADGTTRGFVAIKTAEPVVRITKITVSPTMVTIQFTSNTSLDTTASFVVQEAGTVVNAGTTFNDMTSGVAITGSAGSFQATFAPSGGQHFYRIKRP
jgi:hypothetical protein